MSEPLSYGFTGNDAVQLAAQRRVRAEAALRASMDAADPPLPMREANSSPLPLSPRESPPQPGPPSLESVAKLAADFQNLTGQPLTPLNGAEALMTGRAAGVGTADGRGQAIYSALVARIEHQERAMEQVTAELARLKAELLAAAAEERFEAGGNQIDIDGSVDQVETDIQIGIASLRLLRASLGGELPQLGADMLKALLSVSYEALKRACRAVCRLSKWLLRKADKFVDAAVVAGGAAAGPYALWKIVEELDVNLPQLIKDLEPVLHSLGM